jgi:hypothetical protein
MAHHNDSVAGDRRVQLEGGDPESEGPGESDERVLGSEAARAAMTLQIEGSVRIV